MGHTLKYGLPNWPIIVRVLTEWYNSCPHYFFHKISLLKNHPGYLKVLDLHVSVSRECLVSCSLHSNCLVILLKKQMLYFTLVCLQWVLCAILFFNIPVIYFFLSSWAGDILQILQSDWFRERAVFSPSGRSYMLITPGSLRVEEVDSGIILLTLPLTLEEPFNLNPSFRAWNCA